MNWEALYYVWAGLLFLFAALSWATNLLTLPGNWGILLAAAVHWWFLPANSGEPGLTPDTLIVLTLLAVAGEAVEAFAGTAGAAKQGGSRRGLVLSLVGAMVGSVAGAALGLPIPIPVIGSGIAAIVGGAIGAFCGVMLGESWKGTSLDHQLEIGRAAFMGRILGTVGKLAAGIAMLAVVLVDVLT